MKRLTVILVVAALATFLIGCGGSGGSVNCSLKNPARLTLVATADHNEFDFNEAPDQWPKFRRDRQNTGTITLAAENYDSLARMEEQRELVWVFPEDPLAAAAKEPFVASPVINLTQTKVYVASTDGVLYGLFLRNGLQVPTDPNDTPDDSSDIVPFQVVASPLPFVSSAVVGVRDGVDAVFIGGGNALVYAVDDQGVFQDDVWPNTLDNFIAASLTMGIDGTVYTSSLGTGFIGVCPNGARRFVRSTGSSESAPAVGRQLSDEDLDGQIYFGTDDRSLRALTVEGVQRWVASLSAPILAAPVVELDALGAETVAIYAVDSAGLFGKFDPEGRRYPGFNLSRPVLDAVNSSPALARGRLYAALLDKLLAIDTTSGAVLWEFAAGSRIQTSPAVVLKAGDSSAPPIIVFGADDGKIYFVRDGEGGPTLVGQFEVDAQAPFKSIVSSPAIASDGTVVFGGQNGRVYAIR